MKHLIGIVFSVFFFHSNAFGQDEYRYERKYKSGDRYSYELSTTEIHNGSWIFTNVANAHHNVVLKNGILTEKIRWKTLNEIHVRRGASDLSKDALAVKPYPAGDKRSQERDIEIARKRLKGEV